MHSVGPMSTIDYQLFELLVREHHVAVYRTARRILRCDADAQDVTQRVFLHALQDERRLGGGFDAERTLRWLATRLSLNELRGVRRRAQHERNAPMSQPSATPPEELYEREQLTALDLAVAELDDELRVPLVLRYQEGLSYSMIGRAAGVPESTAYERVRRGLERLRATLLRLGVALPATGVERLCTAGGAVVIPADLEAELLALRPPAVGPSALPGKMLATGALSLVTLTGTLLEPPRAPVPPVAVAVAAVEHPAGASHGRTLADRSLRLALVETAARGSDSVAQDPAAQDPQPGEVRRVPLQIQPAPPAGMMVDRRPRGAAGPLTGAMVEGADYDLDFAGVATLRLTGRPVAEDRFVLRVDRDDDGDFDEEEARTVAFGDKVEVAFTKRRGDGVKGAITAWLWPSRHRGQDAFAVQVRYAAVGTVTVGDATASIQLMDVDGNGYFDRAEFGHGTTIRLDLDGEGANSLSGEFVSGHNMFELDGRTLSFGEVARDGSWVEIADAALPMPRLDRPFPEVELRTLTGERIETRGRQRPLLIALWASWCKPCVEKMPQVRELARRSGVDLLYYSVDESDRVARAKEIAEQRGFGADALAAPGAGRADPLWTMINSMHGGSLGVPKYALLDRDGVLRYAGADLENLAVALQSPDRTTTDALLENPANLDIVVELRQGAGTLRFLGREFALRLVEPGGAGEGAEGEPGPVLQIDRDGDGRFVGPAEHMGPDQAFDLEGGQLELGAIAEDRSWLRLVRSEVGVPRIGRQIRGFVFRRRGGDLVFLGKVERATALVFWSAANEASLAAVDRFLNGGAADNADVHLLCVDRAEGFDAAMAGAAARGWPAAMLGPSSAGGAEFVYQACAGMPTTGRTTPLFLVVDAEGSVLAGTADPAVALDALRPR